MHKWGYCRISTPRQSLRRQIENIRKAYPEAEILSDVYTGVASERPAWQKLLQMAVSGDTIVFDSVSRMSRNAQEGIRQYMELYHRGVNLVFLNEPMLNTEVYQKAVSETIPMTGTDADLILSGVNQYLCRLAERQIEIAFRQAEKEVRDLRSRTKDGMYTKGAGDKIRKSRTGKTYPNAKRSLHTARLRRLLEACKAFGGSVSDVQLAKEMNISRQSVFRGKRELQERLIAEHLTKEELLLLLGQEQKQQESRERKRQSENKSSPYL